HVIWMAPASYATMLAAGALPLFVAGRIAPRIVTRAVQTFVVVLAACVGFLFLFHPALHALAIVVLAAGVAWQIAPRLARLGPTGVRRVSRGAALAVAALIVAATVIGLGGIARERRRIAALPGPTAGAPNVLLLVLDTVRAM